MNPKSYCLAAIVFCTSASLAWSQGRTLDETDRGLKIISGFAESMCKQFSLEGKSRSTAASFAAEAEVSKLLRALVGAKVVAQVRAENADYVGLLQKDLLAAMSESNGCKERYFSQLIERVLPTKPIVLKHEQSSRHVRIETLTPDGQRCVEIQDVKGVSFNCTRE